MTFVHIVEYYVTLVFKMSPPTLAKLVLIWMLNMVIEPRLGYVVHEVDSESYM